MSAIKLCGVIPTFNNPATIRAVVEHLRQYVEDIVVVDDGSDETARALVEQLAAEGLATAVFRRFNGGKGAAVKTGLLEAQRLGFSHALQVDADGQHAIDDAPKLMAAASAQPKALVLAAPIFDASAPKARLIGRRITQFWTRVETGGPAIDDPMCGFRIYPVDAALMAAAVGDRMDFDPEIAVRIQWLGTPIINVPTAVRYTEGGVSHFRMFRDNLLISWMHTRLVFGAMWRWLRGAKRSPQ